jgi:zinc protease
MGWEEDVRSMPEGYDYGRLFFERHYRPDNCAIVVAGDFEKGRVLSQILKHYQLWQPGAEVATPDPEPQQTEARRAEITWPGPTTPRVVMGFHVPAYNPDNMDASTMDVLNELAFGPTSPFYRRWVEERMRAQSVESEVPRTVDPGLFTIEVVLKDPADLADVRQDILTTLQDLATDPPTEDLLERLKQHLINEFKSRLETPESLAYALGQMYVLTREYRSMQWYFIRLRRVAPEDIQRFATEHLIESNSTTVTLVSAEES